MNNEKSITTVCDLGAAIAILLFAFIFLFVTGSIFNTSVILCCGFFIFAIARVFLRFVGSVLIFCISLFMTFHQDGFISDLRNDNRIYDWAITQQEFKNWSFHEGDGPKCFKGSNFVSELKSNWKTSYAYDKWYERYTSGQEKISPDEIFDTERRNFVSYFHKPQTGYPPCPTVEYMDRAVAKVYGSGMRYFVK